MLRRRAHRVHELSPLVEAAKQARHEHKGEERGRDPQGHVQVALEVIFMVWLFYEIITYIREGAQCLIIGW